MKTTIKLTHILAASVVATSLSAPYIAHAAVSPEEAQKLKSGLTPVGALRAGNADGSIPEWKGGLTKPPANYLPGQHRADPYASDKVKFSITGKNYSQYSDKLSEGQKALFVRYPDTFSMDIYPTHRSASAPEWVYQNTYQNALNAELEAGGSGVKNAFGGTPFPIPANGLEAIWNHNLRWMGEAVHKEYVTYVVYENGNMSRTAGTLIEKYPFYDPKGSVETFNGNLMELMVSYKEPSRRKGEMNLVIDPLNQMETPRQAWQYIPGQRRVRRAPTISYDTPNPGTNGQSTYDDVFMYNGSPDRYDWTLVGKQEMFIPYNNYRFLAAMGDGVTPEEMLPAKHTNPEYERWEQHRVWVVEANLKDGKRHIYSKRRFYIDEDTWNIVMSDSYDARGNLWRTNYTHLINAYEMQATQIRGFVYMDLLAGTYVLNEYDEEPIKVSDKASKFFTPQSVRKLARR